MIAHHILVHPYRVRNHKPLPANLEEFAIDTDFMIEKFYRVRAGLISLGYIQEKYEDLFILPALPEAE